jgi:hypothetical protein
MLQQCSSVSSCTRMHSHGEALHHMSAFHAFCSEWPYAVFSSVSQYTSDITVVPCCMNSTISTLFLSQKTGVISFLAGRQHLFKLFWLLWWMCASTALTALWFQHSQMKPRFHHLLLMWCDHHLCSITLKKTKPKPFSAYCAYPRTFLEKILCKTCDSLA